MRCAISILVEITTFKIKSEDDLYRQALKINWSNFFDVRKTFAVRGAIFSDLFTSTHYPNLLLKDARCYEKKRTNKKQNGHRPVKAMYATKHLEGTTVLEK